MRRVCKRPSLRQHRQEGMEMAEKRFCEECGTDTERCDYCGKCLTCEAKAGRQPYSGWCYFCFVTVVDD